MSNNQDYNNSNLSILPLSDHNISDYFTYFEQNAFSDYTDNPLICYCTMWNMTEEQIKNEIEIPIRTQKSDVRSCCRKAAEKQIEQNRLHGYLAYLNGKPVGWCNAGEKEDYHFWGRHVEKAPTTEENAGKIKSIVCLQVAPDYRNQGIAHQLVEYVCAQAQKEGYEAVEAYPHAHSVPAKEDYAALLQIYKNCDFEITSRTAISCICQKKLTPQVKK